MARDCDYNKETGCVTCAAVDPIPAVPAQVFTLPNIGWNAGANSVDMIDGDLHVVFGAGEANAGMVLGFRSARDSRPPVTPAFVTHGWYFYNLKGAWAVPMEQGTQIGDPVSYDDDSVFEVRRIAGTILYYRNGSLVHTSTRRSNGLLRVMACLYAAGDQVQ